MEWKDLAWYKTQHFVLCVDGREKNRDSSLPEKVNIFIHCLVLHDIINFIPNYTLRKSNSRVKLTIPAKTDLHPWVSKRIDEYISSGHPGKEVWW